MFSYADKIPKKCLFEFFYTGNTKNIQRRQSQMIFYDFLVEILRFRGENRDIEFFFLFGTEETDFYSKGTRLLLEISNNLPAVISYKSFHPSEKTAILVISISR